MKYAILLCDGMSDRPIHALDNKTPLEIARVPWMDSIAKAGTVGIADTIPRGMSAGSDVANLSILGYDPQLYYTGRGPLEAANMGIRLDELDVAFRCNLVSTDGDALADYSAGHITSKEGKILMRFIDEKLHTDSVRFYYGKSYRHLMMVKVKDQQQKKDLVRVTCIPPHDIIGKKISKHLPRGKGAALLTKLMKDSRPILEAHEINAVRLDLKENPANMIWLWGQGTNPNLPSYKERFGLTGAVISAVDLINGIGKLVGLEPIAVPGATGYYDTNYKGKGEHALRCLEDKDFVFVHVEAADEAGHNGDLKEKIKAIERFDRSVVKPLVKWCKERQDCRIMVLSDHATPLSLRTHTDDPIPFVIYGAGVAASGVSGFNEKNAASTNVMHASGAELTDFFFRLKKKPKRRKPR